MAYPPIISSGIGVIDRTWGGYYRCGTYLVFGRASTGKSLLTMKFVQRGALQEEHGLIISSDRPKHLMIKAASIGFDLREACASGSVKLMRSPQVLAREDITNERVATALGTLTSLIRRIRPDRVVVDDFERFVQFDTFEHFSEAFTAFLDQIDASDTTLNLVMPEPANQQSQRVIDFMSGQMTGAIHIEYAEEDAASMQRRLTLIPTIGHLSGRVTKAWDVRDIVSEDDDARGERRPSPPELEGSSTQSRRVERDPTSKAAPRGLERPPPIRAVRLGRRSVDQSKPVRSDAAHHITTSSPSTSYETPARWKAGRDVPPSDHVRNSYTDFEAFRIRLQDHFWRRQAEESSFLLIAMRMDRQQESAARAIYFEFLVNLSSDLIGSGDRLLVDLYRQRLIILLSDRPGDDAHAFIPTLANRLRSEAPHTAEHLLLSASAIVVPNGRPFRDADEFLSYALEES